MQNSGITEIFQFHNHIRVCFVLFIYLFHNFYIFFWGGGVDGVFVEHNQNLRWFFFHIYFIHNPNYNNIKLDRRTTQL
jgi:hypothetical protein